jgi:flavin reductase (DIM6/NTAB) family NADH-FMN oxidoreductase RutF
MSEPAGGGGQARGGRATGSARFGPATAALSPIAMPVVVVAAAKGPVRSCATATVMYTSLVPPEVAVALHPGSRTSGLIRETGELSVSILSADQLEIAARAGRSAAGEDKLAATGIPAAEAPAGFGAPGVAGSIAILWCRVIQEIETGDHVLIVARVDAHATHGPPGSQLLRAERRYVALGEWLSDESPEKYPL